MPTDGKANIKGTGRLIQMAAFLDPKIGGQGNN